ncbi:hypothetical protein MMC24_002392 [Lignoscripta atroalba]|nr:hypothetical protein [Lignoscripta atroalba]
MSETLPPVLFQRPFLRCFVMGRSSVAAFALLSGYVNALKPIRQTRAGNIDSALSGVAKSAFRRTGRFVLPAMIATVLSWLLCQFGGYSMASVVDSSWIRDTSPRPSASFANALYDLVYNMITTWTNGANEYDKIQWTLTYLLRGSMLVYLTLFATAYLQPKYRMLVYGVLYLYYWVGGDGKKGFTAIQAVHRGLTVAALIGINIYAGLLFAELSLDPTVQSFISDHQPTFSASSCFLIVLGFFFMSYPEDHPEWARWSTALSDLGGLIFPQGAETARFYPAVGTNVLVLGIILNPTTKRILSNSVLCWMGKMSFGVYLLHAPLIRTLLTWMLFGLSSRPPGGKDKDGHDLPPGWVPLASRWLSVFAIPLFYVVLYRAAHLWVLHVDPLCGRVTNWVEEKVFREDARSEKPLLMA